MGWGLVFTLASLPIIVAMIIYALWNRPQKNGPKQTRGTTPSQNGVIAGGGIDGGRGGHNHYVVIPRDPQEYTRVMTPKK
ncbi:hypothetical protein [Aliiroseovarius subalbicans]|uniref:hypothetical protein n=1 Tax=Aliiroseovarius subalbicans TaxID=2925840 RepID=UPI001F58B42A|nr:hypothetical protein [Aliiroseovarius subalbicans]MCI2398804.1 hypothetical protein [Aliiroseovarius subalbicans]